MRMDKDFRRRTLHQLEMGELHAYRPLGTIDEFYFMPISLSTSDLISRFPQDLTPVSIEEVRMVFENADIDENAIFN